MALKWRTELKETGEAQSGTITMTLQVKIEKEETGDRYYAITGDLPGCATFGDTPQEAADNMVQTIKDWLIKDNH